MQKLFLAAALVVMSGCAAKQFTANRLDQSGGVVELKYQFARFDQHLADIDQAATVADEYCRTWGYDAGSMQGGQRTYCHEQGKDGECLSGRMLVEFRCVQAGAPR